MNAFPVMVRELRAEARHPLNYWLRMLGPLVMLFILVLVVADLSGRVAGQGGVVFGALHPTLYSLIWVLVPIMTCDAISRERREGTLGLLFLTPLRPADIALAKAATGILRALTLILAVLPLMAIPLLLGGITGRDWLRAVMMDAMAMLGAVASGLLASSYSREFSRAALLSLLLALVSMMVLGDLQLLYALYLEYSQGTAPMQDESLTPWVMFMIFAVGGWVLSSGVDNIWQQSSFRTTPDVLWICLAQVTVAAGWLLMVLFMIHRRLRRYSVETGMTERQAWWWKKFCTPRLFTAQLRQANQRRLRHNPIGWLQRRSWSARLSCWSWLGALVVVQSAELTVGLSSGMNLMDLMEVQPFLAACIAIGIAFSSADSFRRERETGALELLLVTPLTERQIVWGRVRGLYGQYALVTVLLIWSWWYVVRAMPIHSASSSGILALHGGFGLLFLASFLCLPIIGLDQSLHRRGFFNAWMLTVALGLFVPLLAPWLVTRVVDVLLRADIGKLAGYDEIRWAVVCFGLSVLLQAAFAMWSWSHVIDNLRERRFATNQ